MKMSAGAAPKPVLFRHQKKKKQSCSKRRKPELGYQLSLVIKQGNTVVSWLSETELVTAAEQDLIKS